MLWMSCVSVQQDFGFRKKKRRKGLFYFIFTLTLVLLLISLSHPHRAALQSHAIDGRRRFISIFPAFAFIIGYYCCWNASHTVHSGRFTLPHKPESSVNMKCLVNVRGHEYSFENGKKGNNARVEMFYRRMKKKDGNWYEHNKTKPFRSEKQNKCERIGERERQGDELEHGSVTHMMFILRSFSISRSFHLIALHGNIVYAFEQQPKKTEGSESDRTDRFSERSQAKPCTYFMRRWWKTNGSHYDHITCASTHTRTRSRPEYFCSWHLRTFQHLYFRNEKQKRKREKNENFPNDDGV